MKKLIVACVAAVGLSTLAFAHEGMDMSKGAASSSTPEMVTVKGEVLDMACYMDHAAMGEKHASCAKTCIESGLPVGLKADNGKTYLLIGEHKPVNSVFSPYAGKTVTVKGKAVSRDGINMIENVELVKS